MKQKRLHKSISYIALLSMICGFFAGVIPQHASASPISITVDGNNSDWDGEAALGTSANAGWQGFHIDNFKLANDNSNLYFWVDAANVPNWGDNGQFIDIAINVNSVSSAVYGNPWGGQFNFTGTTAAPQYHIVMRIQNDNQIKTANVYSSADMSTPLTVVGAQWGIDRAHGFEGKIPLSALNLKNGDVLNSIVVLSGNNSAEHGAFDVIPEAVGNKIAASWNESGSNINVQSTYSNPYTVHVNYTPVVDGAKDAVWDDIPTLGTSSTAGWQGFQVNNFRLTNDNSNLSFWVDASNVPNWGDNGQFIDIALNVNSVSSAVYGAPWGGQFNYSGAAEGPNYHIVMRVKNDNALNGAAVYGSADFSTPLLATWSDLQGAQFAVDRTKGFEGSIPLSILGLHNDDLIKAIVVHSGNNASEHGAFDVIPEAASNTIAASWNESSQVNVQSTYSNSYKVTGIKAVTNLSLLTSNPIDTATNVALDASVQLNFTENISLAADHGITIQDADNTNITFNTAVSGKQLLLTPTANFSHQKLYTVHIPAGVLTGQDTNTTNQIVEISFMSKAFPTITGAIADSQNQVDVNLSEASEGIDYSKFAVYDGADKLTGTSMQGADNKKVTIQLTDGITDVSKHFIVRYDTGNSGFYADKAITMRKILDDYVYEGNDLGLIYTNANSTFKVWAPTAEKVSLLLYTNSTTAKEAPDTTSLMVKTASSGVWSAEISGDQAGKYYMYKVEFADGTVTYALDPYARASSVNSGKTAIVNLAATNPNHWDPNTKPNFVNSTDAVIYELHTRDFSLDSSSGISAGDQGKFKAFTETGTTLVSNSSIKTGIDHLQELGITHVHLLPSYDFGSLDETKVDDPSYVGRKFNWGYDPVNYNVPEGSYATDPTVENPAKRITEFKEMVQALHDKGIRIVLDVVYNHTYESGITSDYSVFDKIVPGYFYRSDETGTYTNGSGTGNEIASERPMVRKYIKDSVKYLAEQYNVDGFRFDLAGLIDTNTVKQLTNELKNEVDPNTLLYGEPWTGGSTSLPASLQMVKGAQKDTAFAVFNDNFRGAIKGDNDGDGKGFATGAAGKEADIVKGVKGSINDFTNSPIETINYVTVHDNLNLWDKVLKTQGKDATVNPFAGVDKDHLFDNESVKRSLLSNGIVLTSQGIPLFQAGDEMLRSKFGDKNSYASSDEINKMRWNQKADYKPVFDYYQGLIQLRKDHPAFRMTTKDAIVNNLQVIKQDGNIVSFQLKNFANGDAWKNIVVIYNANSTSATVNLPTSGSWKVVVDDKHAGVADLSTVSGGTTVVAGLSIQVLYDEQNLVVPVATSIALSPSTLGLNAGDSRFIAAVVKDQNGNPMPDQQVSWSSSNTKVAAISVNGKITAMNNGAATITAAIGNISANVDLHVEPLVPTTIALSGPTSVFATRSIQLSALVKDQFNQEIYNAEVTWASSDPAIARINSSGNVVGISQGMVIVTAHAGGQTAQIQLSVKPNIKRYIQFNYVRPDNNYTDWNIWVWNTGIKNDQIDFVKFENGMASVDIEIAPETTNIGFVLRKGTDWSTAKQDIGSDRFIVVDPDEVYSKAIITSMVSDVKILPTIKGPVLADGNITFKYRDDALFKSGEMSSITDVKLKVQGQANLIPMVYNQTDEYFGYTLMNAVDGTYTYSFVVTKNGITTEVNDPKNTINGVSAVTFHKPLINVAAAIEPGEISYSENAVLNVTATSSEQVDLSEMYVDLTPLGGPNKVNIDLALKAQTIAVNQTVSVGAKSLTVTVVDQFGNKTTTTASITVKPRVLASNKDFDWDEARIYFMLTDRFSDGDTTNNTGVIKDNLEAYHGGDFQGIINKLDYLQDLGINTVWITPIVENIHYNKGADFNGIQYGYHGYWAQDFTKIDEHLGDLAKFKELIDKAHDKGIKIMVDVVLNHTGYGLKPNDPIHDGITQQDKDRFAGLLRTENIDDVRGELAELPDFKTEDPAVRAQVINLQADWLNRAKTARGDQIDYFRVDTVKNVDNTTWKAFKNKLTSENPNFKMIGEYFGGSMDNTGGNLKNGQMDSILDFDFKQRAQDFVNGNLEGTESYLEVRDTRIDNTATLGQFLSSHDENGFLSERVGGDEGKLKVAAALQITSKGQPVIYYGEELGQSGKNAGNLANGELSENRKDMPWDKLIEEAGLHDHYQKLLKIRAKYSKLISKGSRTKVAGSDVNGYLIFDKNYNNQDLVIGLNVTNQLKSTNFMVPFAAGTDVIDEYSGNHYTVDQAGKVTVNLPSKDNGGTVILAKYSDPSAPTGPTSTSTPVPTPVSTPKPTPTPVITPSPVPAVAKVEAKDIHKDSNKNFVVETDSESVELPSNLDGIVGNSNLIVKNKEVSVELPQEVLKAVQGLIPATSLKDAHISLQASKVTKAETDVLINKSNKDNTNVQVKTAGDVFEFKLSITTKEGQTQTLSTFDKPLILKLKVNPGADKALLGMYYISDEGKVEYVGGKLNGDELEAPIYHFSKYAVLEMNKSFTDVAETHWVSAALKEAAAKHIIEGMTENEFSPTGQVTRAQFSTMIVRALGLKAAGSAKFKDVPSGKWYASAITAASENGIVTGRSGELFAPDAYITREEMAAMITRAYQWKMGITQSAKGSSTFTDRAEASSWAIASIDLASELQLIVGNKGAFKPKVNASRAEAVQIVINLLHK